MVLKVLKEVLLVGLEDEEIKKENLQSIDDGTYGKDCIGVVTYTGITDIAAANNEWVGINYIIPLSVRKEEVTAIGNDDDVKVPAAMLAELENMYKTARLVNGISRHDLSTVLRNENLLDSNSDNPEDEFISDGAIDIFAHSHIR
ncbi:MAG: hypothetical protein NC489_29650 [Ruminococcus flavefaciens]|nr:hypothetical protein [Ruminococcus flavefaciens]